MSAESKDPERCCDCCDCDCHDQEGAPLSLYWLVALLLVSTVLPSLLRPSPVAIYYGTQAPVGGRP